ncbi:MAG: hypothetical protein AB7P76_10570 [Candidatus Melainabacteria bacterium]
MQPLSPVGAERLLFGLVQVQVPDATPEARAMMVSRALAALAGVNTGPLTVDWDEAHPEEVRLDCPESALPEKKAALNALRENGIPVVVPRDQRPTARMVWQRVFGVR